MRKNLAILLIIITIVFILLFNNQKQMGNQNTKQNVPSQRSVYLGAWVGGFWNNQAKTLDPTKMYQFEKYAGKKMAIVNYYRGWDELDKPEVIDQLNSVDHNGWVPMISANPYFTTKCVDSEHENVYQAIIEKKCDYLIKGIAANFKAYGKPLFFRFAWEMNIDSIEWSIQYTGSNSEEFVKAWQHIHTLFKNDGVENVKWLFAINVEKSNSIPIKDLYPGDAYVDWIGIDGYNWGTTQSWSSWQTFDQVYRSTYTKLLEVAPTKPLMLAEVNSAAPGGDKAQWLTDMLEVQIPLHYPEVDAIMFFNEDKTVQEGVDWNIEKSSDYINALEKALKNPIYKSSITLTD